MAEITIPVKGGQAIVFDTDVLTDESFPEQAYLEIILQGVKHFANQKMADIKLTGLRGPALEKAKAVAMEVATENLAKLSRGEIRITGGKAKTKGLDRAVKVEAMRLAKALIKDAIKREGKVKVSAVAGRDITAKAEELLGTDYGAEILAKAKAAVEERNAATVAGIDLSSVKEDPKLAKAAAEKASKSKKPKAEVPAGVVTKAKPTPQHVTH